MAKRVHQPREDAEFDFIRGMSGVPVLAYFTGTWPKAIEPCRAMDLVVGDITGAPSYVLLKEGEVVAHGTGSMTITEVREFLDDHL